MEQPVISEQEMIDALKQLLGGRHPAGAAVGLFVALFTRHYSPPEESYKYYTDLLDDLHSFIESMVNNVTKLFPKLGEHKKSFEWISTAVEAVIFPEIYSTVFSIFKLKNEQEDMEIDKKLEWLRNQRPEQQYSFLGLDSNMLLASVKKPKTEIRTNTNRTEENTTQSQTNGANDTKKEKQGEEKEDVPFRSAIDSMAQLVTLSNPRLKLSQLVRASADIDLSSSLPACGADELLPILSYVVTQAKIPNLVSEFALIEEFIPKALQFELEGCLLTHMQVALEYLKTLRPNNTSD